MATVTIQLDSGLYYHGQIDDEEFDRKSVEDLITVHFTPALIALKRENEQSAD